MAINVNAANNQAAQLYNNISQLRDAKRQMLAYRSSVSNNWQGKEVSYILTAIDQVIRDIDAASGSIESLSSDIKTVAAQIKREEEAAAAAAARAKQQRIEAAQNAYNSACAELNSLMEQRNRLITELSRASRRNQAGIFAQIKSLEDVIRQVQSKVASAGDALNAARR